MVRLDRTRHMLLPDEIGTEEHEGIRRAGDVPKRPALARGSTPLGGRVRWLFGRREKLCIGGQGDLVSGVEG